MGKRGGNANSRTPKFQKILKKLNLMKCGTLLVKKNKFWLIRAVDRATRQTIAWVLGRRDIRTFKRLYEKLKHLKNCIFYTVNWDAFSAVFPAERHVIGKAHTYIIEGNNSNTRHHLGRFTRRIKVVSKSEHMVDITIRLWVALPTPFWFNHLQNIALSIYRCPR